MGGVGFSPAFPSHLKRPHSICAGKPPPPPQTGHFPRARPVHGDRGGRVASRARAGRGAGSGHGADGPPSAWTGAMTPLGPPPTPRRSQGTARRAPCSRGWGRHARGARTPGSGDSPPAPVVTGRAARLPRKKLPAPPAAFPSPSRSQTASFASNLFLFNNMSLFACL